MEEEKPGAASGIEGEPQEVRSFISEDAGAGDVEKKVEETEMEKQKEGTEITTEDGQEGRAVVKNEDVAPHGQEEVDAEGMPRAEEQNEENGTPKKTEQDGPITISLANFSMQGSAWEANTTRVSIADILQMYTDQMRKLILFFSTKGSGEYTFADFSEKLGVEVEQLRSLVVEVRQCIEELGIGTIRSIHGVGYKFDQALDIRNDFYIQDVMPLLTPDARAFAIHLSKHPNIPHAVEDLKETLGLKQGDMPHVLRAMRKLTEIGKTHWGVFSESGDRKIFSRF
jgi:hypothetical protein